MRIRAKLIICTLTCILLLFASSCGYGLRTNKRDFMLAHDIRVLHVPAVVNNSFKAGVDLTVYNALRRRIAMGGYVRITDNPNEADAILTTTVTDANYRPLAVGRADQLAPLDTGPGSVQVATSYVVTLSCSFQLTKNKESLWKDSFTRTKSFAASTFLGVLGSTSALINESEYERTLLGLADGIVMDADETMNALF